MMNTLIYLDNNATTQPDPKVLEKMLPYFTEQYANASSTLYPAGKKAAEAVQIARQQVAKLLHCQEKEIYFTSGATEAINWALKGGFERHQGFKNHIITCQTEHKAVLDVCRYLEKQGAQVTYLPVDEMGAISLDDLEKSIHKQTFMIALMYANNETGLIHPVDDIARIARKHDVLFFCDATQAVGKVPVNVAQWPVDLLCLSAHKMYGPKGVGALFIRKTKRSLPIAAFMIGGGQEQAMRSGTLNVPGIVGMGAAAEIYLQTEPEERQTIENRRNRLEAILSTLPEVRIQSLKGSRLPNTSNITIRFIRAEELIVSLGNIALSTGSACTTGSLSASHVLTAMGLNADDAKATLRISLSKFTSDAEVEAAGQQIVKTVTELRSQSPIWQMFQSGIIT